MGIFDSATRGQPYPMKDSALYLDKQIKGTNEIYHSAACNLINLRSINTIRPGLNSHASLLCSSSI